MLTLLRKYLVQLSEALLCELDDDFFVVVDYGVCTVDVPNPGSTQLTVGS